jgi:hypothetical protein
VQVRERMLPIANAYHKDAAYEFLDQVTLAWLIKDMEGRGHAASRAQEPHSHVCGAQGDDQ